MLALWTALALALIILGHIIRLLRWELFIEIYEKPQSRALLRSLSAGFFLNTLLPLHLGDLARVLFAGKKMENGVALSLATVLVERYLDVAAVGVIFAIFLATGIGAKESSEAMLFYVGGSLLLFLLTCLFLRYSKYIKLLINTFASIFNEEIQLRLMFGFWTLISSFKDIYRTVPRLRLTIMTALMWLCYVLSYAAFSKGYPTPVTTYDIFHGFFGTTGLEGLWIAYGDIYFAAYLLSPPILLWLLSYLPLKARWVYETTCVSPEKYLHILPQVSGEDRLRFLEGYFAERDKTYLSRYLEINRGISILRDYSAGSNATTMLCMDENKTFFRKYAFAGDGDKLFEQILWIEEEKGKLPLPAILGKDHDALSCYYDMPYNKNAVNFFAYIHSSPEEKAWDILKRALNCLQEKLYAPTAFNPENGNALRQYIKTKVSGNLKKIKEAKQFQELLAYDEIIINGFPYKNLDAYENFLSEAALSKIFASDAYAKIHGDLTIENIICVLDGKDDDFYIIDPNTGNLHESPFLDLGKLLQSLHGGYEFLMRIRHVNIAENRVDFLFTKSMAYENLLKKFDGYLKENFSAKEVKSVYCHEIVHWLRLLPYKINKNGKLAVIFYARLLMLLKDVFGEEIYEKQARNV